MPEYLIALTLLGWGIGGLIGGVLADYLGRKRMMMFAIIAYSITTGLSAFAWDWVSFAVLRFIVGLAIGSEWVTGASIVSELWPDRARGRGVGLMQSGLGVGFFLASFAWLFVGAMGPNAWRYMFLIGVLPALMTLWVRRAIPESERWERVNDQRQAALERKRSGETLGAQEEALARFTLSDLFAEPQMRNRVLLCLAISFATTFAFWGISTWIPPYVGAFAAKAGLSAQEWASYGGMALNGCAVIGYVGFGFMADAYRPQADDDLLHRGVAAERRAAVPVGARPHVHADRRRPVRRLRVRPVHLDGGMAAGAVPDPHAGDGRGLRVQHAAAHRLDRAADLRLADRRGRRLQPSRRRDLAHLYSESRRSPVPSGNQGQAAAGVICSVPGFGPISGRVAER